MPQKRNRKTTAYRNVSRLSKRFRYKICFTFRLCLR